MTLFDLLALVHMSYTASVNCHHITLCTHFSHSVEIFIWEKELMTITFMLCCIVPSVRV